MSLNEIRQRIPDYARDLRLNLGTVLTPQGAPGLTEPQIWGTALTAALAARATALSAELERLARDVVDDSVVAGARSAAAIMGMNNIYYRFTHLVEDDSYATLPAQLRMSVIGKPGIAAVDFELFSLAASAVTGCGKCIVAHERQLRRSGLSQQGIQSAVRIAAVIHGVAALLDQPGLTSSLAAA